MNKKITLLLFFLLSGFTFSATKEGITVQFGCSANAQVLGENSDGTGYSLEWWPSDMSGCLSGCKMLATIYWEQWNSDTPGTHTNGNVSSVEGYIHADGCANKEEGADPCDPNSANYDPYLCENQPDPCDRNSTSYDPYLCENQPDPCERNSTSYDPYLCEANDPCNVYSPNYNPYQCEANDPCNPLSPVYNPYQCEANDPCNPYSPNYNPYQCGSNDPCDPYSPNYDPYQCGSSDPCDPYSPNYDPYQCGSGDPCDPNSPNYDYNACYGGENNPCEPSSPNYNPALCTTDDCPPGASRDECGECVGGNTGKTAKLWYQDQDGDGWGNSNVTKFCSNPGSGWADKGGDVNDDCNNANNYKYQCILTECGCPIQPSNSITKNSATTSNINECVCIDPDPTIAFPYFNKAQIMAEIQYRMQHPWAIDQNETGLCGPACIAKVFAETYPIGYQSMVMGILEDGFYTKLNPANALYHTYKLEAIEPVREINPRNPSYPNNGAKMAQVDFILLSTIRSTQNVLNYNPLAITSSMDGITTPGDMRELMEKFLGMPDVVDNTNLITPKNYSELNTLQNLYNDGVKIFMLVNADGLLNKENPLFAFPNHWVQYQGGLSIDNVNQTVSFKVYTWGNNSHLVNVSMDTFNKYFYGTISGSMP